MAVENLFTLDCPKCNTRHTSIVLLCQGCHKPLDCILEQNPFELLGLPLALTTPFATLKAAFITAQKALHPDKFITQPKLFTFATKVSSAVNTAFTTLKCPFLRAQSFLRAHGIEPSLQKISLPTSTLDTILSFQEQACSGNIEECYQALSYAQTRITEILRLLPNAIQSDKIDNARFITAELHYLIKIQKEARKYAK